MAGGPIEPYNNTTNLQQNGGLLNPSLPTTQTPFNFWAKPVYTNADGTYWSPGFDGATYSNNPWSYLYIGVPSTQPYTPGECRVRVHVWRDVDKKKPLGSDGARVAIHGVDLADVDIEIRIWTPEQLRQLSILWSTYMFPPAYKGSPPAYDVRHPELDYYGIKSLQFTGGEGPMIDNNRVGTFKINAIQFAKPSTKSTTKTEVKPVGSLLDAGAYPTPGSNVNDLGPR